MPDSSSKSTKPKQSQVVQQITRFGMVGLMSFAIDFLIANILAGPLHVNIVAASVISGTIAMINSFVFNQRFTFRTRHTDTNRIVYFFLITAFGIYVIRPIIVHLLTSTWLWPAHLTYRVTHALHLPLSQSFDTRNMALVVAVIIVLFYNFFSYKKFVFTHANQAKK